MTVFERLEKELDRLGIRSLSISAAGLDSTYKLPLVEISTIASTASIIVPAEELYRRLRIIDTKFKPMLALFDFILGELFASRNFCT